MKFLVDNQLPTALAQYLRKRGFDCQHALEAGLGDALDTDICRYAELQERIIISKDEDFFYFAKQREAKIRVIWVRLGNCRTQALLEESVHLGDRFSVGTAEVAVTQPRLPCYKLGIRFGSDNMVKRFLASERTGFYVAVLRE